jgi:hypothetical protein
MLRYPKPWWIAGGWAIDLFLGGHHRTHHDVDVAVLRRDQGDLHHYLTGWSMTTIRNGASFPWLTGEYLVLPVHEIHATHGNERLELLFNEAEHDRWLFRRNTAISLPLHRLGCQSASGIPYICPEVVLLYKAKTPRQIDCEDFERTLPHLESARRSWLAGALRVCHPEHPWIDRL